MSSLGETKIARWAASLNKSGVKLNASVVVRKKENEKVHSWCHICANVQWNIPIAAEMTREVVNPVPSLGM